MPKQKVNKEFVVHQALKMFRKKSYHQATMADIGESVGLLKGSIYHYFDSKEELMREVMFYVDKFFRDQVFVHAYDKRLQAKERLEKMIAVTEHVFLGSAKGNIMGNVGLETAHVNPEFQEYIQIFFKQYFKALKTIYSEKYPEEKAQELAEQTVAEMEGSLMLSRIFNKKDYFLKANKRAIERLETISNGRLAKHPN
jgi:TetR/AcrR family transcriptional repressor of nem operon